MTQDPYGQPQGSVVRGEVVPDDEANVTPPTEPMTRLKKVASALRGERTDPAIPVSPAGPDPNGTWPDTDQPAAEDDAGAEDAGAGAATQDPTTTQPDLYGAAARGETDAAEPETVGKHAGAPAQEGLRPGGTGGGLRDFSDLTYGGLLPDASEFKTVWQQVQFRFVDDPQGSVTEAAGVIAQVTGKLEAAIQERQRAISERQRTLRDRWSEGKSTDTESLRETLLMYRAFLDQLTGPKMS